MNRGKFPMLLVLLFLFTIFSINILADYSYNIVSLHTSGKTNGEYYGSDTGACNTGEGNCWVHQCTWIGAYINVPTAGTYNVGMNLIREGSSDKNENMRLEANGGSHYQTDDGSYATYRTFGTFNFNQGVNYIKFSSTRYGEFFYQEPCNKNDPNFHGSVHFNTFTLIPVYIPPVCIDSDDDGICDDQDFCVGENNNNLPDDTSCRNWFLNEFGCHDYTNKEYGFVVSQVDCDYLDSGCKDYHDTTDVCDGNGNIIYGSCDDYSNKPHGTSCGTFYYEYDCHMGTSLGTDVFRREHEFKCDSSGNCLETISDWELYEECSENEFCYVNQEYIVSCKGIGDENFCPELEEIEDMVVEEGDFVELDIHATDLNGDDLVFYYSAPFDSEGGWQTNYKDSGNYSIEVNVSDGECQDSWVFNLEVLDNPNLDMYCFPNFDLGNDEIEIKSVEVNDMDIYKNLDEKLAIERGKDLFVKVRFQALKNISELQIEAYIDIDKEYEDINITDKTIWFDVVDDTTYTRELILNVPDDLNKGDYELKMLFYDGGGLMDTCTYTFKVALPIYSIIIKNIDITPEIVKAGRVIIADIEVKNIGNNTIEDITVEASIPELNVKDSENIKELEPRDTFIVKDLILRIPTCEEPGEYFVKTIVDYEYEKVSKIKLFEIREGEGCSDISEEEVDLLKVMPEAENIVQGDVEIPYTIIITNPNERRKMYIINVDGVDVFGEHRLDSNNVLIIPAKKSQVIYLYVKADISDITGPKPIVVSAQSDTLEQETVMANIIKTEPESCWKRFCKYVKSNRWYPFSILFLIIIIFLFVLFFLLKKDEDEEK